MRYLYLLFIPLVCIGQIKRNYPPVIEGAKEYIYKKANGKNLKLWIYSPINKEVKTPAILFFFGGGFRNGSPEQFTFQARYFANRGIAGIVVDYRVNSRDNVKPIECLSDAKVAIQWIRKNAKDLNIDSNKIIASGGSSGGYLAAASYFVDKKVIGNSDKTNEKPNALILFNPGGMDMPKVNEDAFMMRFGALRKYVNLIDIIGMNAPPTLILHGDIDKTVDITTVRNFTKKMNTLGHKCELKEYKNEPHGFFNFGRSNNGPFYHTLSVADDFLIENGFLEPYTHIK
jgi:acetyl esterase/lipase|tara:strand:- start:154 stop:1014 length:861 start_codon:yes stop_codon:yes gene_type:complete